MLRAKAILYSRVSTDDQNNGYSPDDQRDKLFRFADHQNTEVVAFHHDDESGKSFDRPEWQKILTFIKKNKGLVNYIYFVKWDRFSRNVAESYQMISLLKKMGVEPQAIEQPLDFDVPESKIMLAVYLAAPEVDNDRRALNTFNGMRRAKKMGHWVGTALKGYRNSRNENNKPVMVPEGGKVQDLVVRTFSEFATGLYPIDELRRKMNGEGLKISRNAFWAMLRHKGYIGKVFVPAYKDEPAHWVDGIHDPLISNEVFYAVQDLLLGRKKKNMPMKFTTAREEMPLRGFLECPQCGSNLTGSASRGRLGGRFFYYHCQKGCKERQKANVMNSEFFKMLHSWTPKTVIVETFGAMLKKALKSNDRTVKAEKDKIGQEIGRLRKRLKTAKNMRLDGELEAGEYKEMKEEIEEAITKLLVEESKLAHDKQNYDLQIDFCVFLLSNMDKVYKAMDVNSRQKLLGSILQERLYFKNGKYRTPKLSPIIELMYDISNELDGDKKQNRIFSDTVSHRVARTRIELVFRP